MMTFEAARLRATAKDWAALRRALFAATPQPTTAVPRAAIDKWWRIYYNPEWFGKLTAEVAAAVLVHEVWHPLRNHPQRAKSLVGHGQHGTWNEAADCEIHEGNEPLAAVLRQVGDGGGICERKNYDPELTKGGIAETWFRELLNRPSLKFPDLCHGSGAGGLPGTWELPSPGDGGPPGVNPAQVPLLQRQVAEDIRRVPGAMPAGFLRWAATIVESRIDWWAALPAAVQRVVGGIGGLSRWTFGKPSRRESHDPRLVVPGFIGIRPRVAFLVDTSGSMCERKLGLCLGEIQTCLETVKADVWAVACDAAAAPVQRIAAAEMFELVGGGGTSMCAGFKAVNTFHEEEPFDLAVCLTDGETDWPSKPLDYPVVTLVLGRDSTPAWMQEPPNQAIVVSD